MTDSKGPWKWLQEIMAPRCLCPDKGTGRKDISRIFVLLSFALPGLEPKAYELARQVLSH
jgi:hypothetical protein